MRVLVACEFSGTVRDAFIRAGHSAASCDLLDEKDQLLAFGEGVYKRGKLRSELP